MFDDEIYEVTRDEFKGFIDQLKSNCFVYEEYGFEDGPDETHEIKITSSDGKRHFASIKQFSKNEDVHYYVYEMPRDDERNPPKPIRKITLESPEEVQAFFEVLNKIHKEQKNDSNL